MADNTQTKKEEKDKSNFEKGSEAIKEKGDAKKEGYDDTHENAPDFKEGWQAGHDASDQNDPRGAEKGGAGKRG